MRNIWSYQKRWQAQRIRRVEMIRCRKLRIYQLDRRRDLHRARIQQVVIVTHFLAPSPSSVQPPSHDPLELTLTCSFYWWPLGRGQILGEKSPLLISLHLLRMCRQPSQLCCAMTLQRTFTFNGTSSLSLKNIITTAGNFDKPLGTMQKSEVNN